MSRDLVIIEAPGKLRTLHSIFDQIGLHADICATIGHFLENPADLRDIAIEYRDGQFVETKRQPQRIDSFAYLREQIRRCEGRILIATDNDAEGCVIASDVAALIDAMGVRTPVYRMTFGGLDRESVEAALNTLRPVEESEARPGTARRITDRLIASRLSGFENGPPVGRVQSALLGLAEQGIPHSQLHLKMPAADGGKPFVGKMPVAGACNPAQLLAELGVANLSPAAVAESRASTMATPLNFSDALLALNAGMDLNVERAGELLQQMYEAGDISYPRTQSRAFTGAGVDAAARLARLKGIMAFKRGMVATMTPSTREPHEAIRVLNEGLLARLDIGKPLKLQPTERDAALTIIARQSVCAGIPVQRAVPDLQGAPAWARSIEWHRDTRRVVLPWATPDPAPIQTLDPAAAVLTAMSANAIGRPSTVAGHAARFIERGLVDEQLMLSAKGRALLDRAPPGLKNVLTSANIEQLLDDTETDVPDLVRAALLAAVDGDEARLTDLIEQLELEHTDEDELELHHRPTF
jgi:DNA topoisomerase I